MTGIQTSHAGLTDAGGQQLPRSIEVVSDCTVQEQIVNAV